MKGYELKPLRAEKAQENGERYDQRGKGVKNHFFGQPGKDKKESDRDKTDSAKVKNTRSELGKKIGRLHKGACHKTQKLQCQSPIKLR